MATDNPTTWVDGEAGGTALSAANLNKLEQRVTAALAALEDKANLGPDGRIVSGELPEIPQSGPDVVVTEHGATGDGVANDSPAIAAAIAAARTAGGGTVVFPPGVYRVDVPVGDLVAGLSRIRLTGVGERAATIRASGNHPVVAGAWTNCRIDNLDLDAGGHGGPAMNVHLDKSYIEHVKLLGWTGHGMLLNDGTYGDLGLLNHIHDVHIAQSTGHGIYGTYRFVDSWITGCNIGSTLANISVEGGPLRILGNHLNGAPRHNIELRGNKRITIADNILEGSRREAIIYSMPPWLEEDSPQIQVTGNAFSNGGKESEGTYSAIRFAGVDATKKVLDLSVVANLFSCEDLGSGWKHIVDAPFADRVTASANQWATGYRDPAPVSAPDAVDLVVTGNAGGGTRTVADDDPRLSDARDTTVDRITDVSPTGRAILSGSQWHGRDALSVYSKAECRDMFAPTGGGGGAGIDDAVTGTSTTWSSEKTAAELAGKADDKFFLRDPETGEFYHTGQTLAEGIDTIVEELGQYVIGFNEFGSRAQIVILSELPPDPPPGMLFGIRDPATGILAWHMPTIPA